ncbi:T9SS type A sorting domain-containing protein [Olleya sp. HaHaR_3_96]|uniref:T9SS type A sorting domain-containing protein n=1 Tax=Olleya sp. HaHaR_3_96 TaxID=2745560 RepID=UPI001C4F0D17|nr:T9SS type A sorting domain-containing protein [Olleya sp. HaHaR_3_96]
MYTTSNITIREYPNRTHINKTNSYPNLATELITISGLTKTVNYQIYNVLGAKVSNGFTANTNTINIQNLTNGLYMLKLDNKHTFKFIKK